MPDFKATAKMHGDSVTFFVEGSTDAKTALEASRIEARRIFEARAEDREQPTVTLVPVEEKKS